MMSSDQDRWEFYQDESDKWRWRCTAGNGRIVGAAHQGYVNKSDCKANARRHGWGGCGQLGMDDTWYFYKDSAGEWRWRRTASNGEIVGGSSEGYHNKSDCKANARRFCYLGD